MGLSPNLGSWNLDAHPRAYAYDTFLGEKESGKRRSEDEPDRTCTYTRLDILRVNKDISSR